MKQQFSLFAILSAALLLNSSVVSAQKKDSIAVMKAAEKFVQAFNNFQWEPFRQFFMDDASIFFRNGISRHALKARCKLKKHGWNYSRSLFTTPISISWKFLQRIS